MNVFVLSTGRCGSTTFARACSHIENYSAAHESRTGQLHDRVEYPDDHIEVDNRLSWFLGRLDRQFGDGAFYVHLKRDLEATAESFTRRYDMGIIEGYRKKVIWRADENPAVTPMDVCKHYCDTVNSNIELFLRDKTKTMEFRLESAEDDFQKFWKRIGAEGDLSASVREWQRKYNASDSEKSTNSEQVRSLPARAVRKAARAVREFPSYLREV